VGSDTCQVSIQVTGYPAPRVAARRYRGGMETRELRYFVAVADELHFGRAAQRLGIAQPPLSRAIRQLERRLGVALLERTSRTVALTEAGSVLLREGRAALDAIDAADRRTRRAALVANGHPGLVLVTKAGASNELLSKLLEAYAAEPGAVTVDVVLCGIAEQERLLRDGRADVALLHRPFDSTTGFDTEDLRTEGQVAVLPAGPANAALARPRRQLPGRPRPSGARPCAVAPADLARPSFGGPAGVVPGRSPRRPGGRAGARCAARNDGDRVAAAQPVAGARRPGPSRDPPLTGDCEASSQSFSIGAYRSTRCLMP
jgi:DNA-binding transcriptional LysR family regulator